MSTWVIGDLQGCCESLEALLATPEIAGDTSARFWFAGDLVNRGPCSLATLRAVRDLGDRAVCVLGNHDLHLLGVRAGARKAGKSDTITEILDAPDADELLDWLRTRPLAHHDQGHLMVHAGVLPSWNVTQVMSLAAEVEAALRADDWQRFLQHMYGNEPARWNDNLEGDDRLRVIVNAFTRLRLCTADGVMDFEHKDDGRSPPAGLMPWFDTPHRATRETTVVFGHWSALGLVDKPGVLALDTGCVWGGKLTAARLEDHKIVQVPCVQHRVPD